MTRLRRTLARHLRVLADHLDPSPRIVLRGMAEDAVTAVREAVEASQRRAGEDFRLPRRRRRPADPHGLPPGICTCEMDKTCPECDPPDADGARSLTVATNRTGRWEPVGNGRCPLDHGRRGE